MGLFDSLRHAFNPEYKETFDWLYKNYYKGLKDYCTGFKTNVGGHYIDTSINISNPTYDDMKRIYENKDTIMQFHQHILNMEKMEADKAELISLQKKYPHAFVYYCNECLGGIIYNSAIDMPGHRKSNRYKRNAQINNMVGCMVNIFQRGTYYGSLYSPIPNCNGDRITHNFNKNKYLSEPHSVSDLTYPDVKKILAKKNLFKSKEDEILAALHSEEINIKFDDEIYDNPRRHEYYKQFLLSNSKKESDWTYLVNNLTALDYFVTRYINSKAEEIQREYRLGVAEFKKRKRSGESDVDFNERIIKNQDVIKRLEYAKKKYNDLKRKYPKGLPAFVQYNSYDDGKNSAELSLEEIVESEEEIAKFEKYADEHSAFEKWLNDQRVFASISRNLSLDNWGCYFYDVPLKGVKPDGSETSGEYRVWQHFYSSFYQALPDNNISDDFSYLKENADKNSKFLTGGLNYKTSVFDTIWNLITAHKEKVGDISIAIASNGLEPADSMVFNDSKMEYLISKIQEANIPIYEGEDELCQNDKLTKHILVIEFISNNARLRQTVELIREKYASVQPLISYISLRKGYDFEEVKALEAKKEKEKQAQKAKEEADRRRIQQEKERQQREEEAKRIEQERKERELKDLKDCVSSWYYPTRASVHCFSLYNYYPTTCEWEANNDEWEVRNTIWDFKANPNRPQSDVEIKLRHQRAVNRVMPNLLKLLNHTFGNERLSKLTLVCIPSSKKIVTERRYKDLSDMLCDKTGMINGYAYISVDSDGEAKHLGGTSSAQYSIDSSFFKGKYVILFDDVITSGHSMEVFKSHLENVGAKVICGISIGKTKHERQNKNPIDEI